MAKPIAKLRYDQLSPGDEAVMAAHGIFQTQRFQPRRGLVGRIQILNEFGNVHLREMLSRRCERR